MNKWIVIVKGNIRKLICSGFVYIFGSSVLNNAIAFLSGIILVRILSKSEYGIFSYAWNIFSIVMLLNGCGIASAVLQLCSERNTDNQYCNEVYNFGKKFGLAFNVVLFVVLFIAGVFFPLPINGAGKLLTISSLLPMLIFLFDIQNSYMRAKKMAKQYAMFSSINTALVFCFSVVGALLFKENGLIIGRYVAYGFTVLLMSKIVLFPRKIKKYSGLNDNDKRAMLGIGGISAVNSGLSQILYLVDVFIIGIVLPNEAVIASYKVATQIPTALSFIPTALVIYIYPYFAEHKEDKSWCLRSYKKILFLMGTLNIFILGILYIMAPQIVQITFGKQYLDSVIPFRILSVSYFFSGTFRTIAGNLLVTQRKLKYNMFVAIFSGTLNIVLDVLLISMWGSNGAAIATLLITVVTSILNVGYLLYIFKQKSE